MLPSLGERDLFRAFQLLPGVSGSNEASSGLYVRGGTPDQNRIEYDGFRVYHVDHLFGYFSAFNMDAVDTVELSKGGFEAQHGGALSSVMQIAGKSGRLDRTAGSVGMGLLSFNGVFETPLFNNKGSGLVAVRRSFQSPLYDKILNLYDNNPTIGRPGGGGVDPGGGGRAGGRFSPGPLAAWLSAAPGPRHPPDQFRSDGRALHRAATRGNPVPDGCVQAEDGGRPLLSVHEPDHARGRAAGQPRVLEPVRRDDRAGRRGDAPHRRRELPARRPARRLRAVHEGPVEPDAVRSPLRRGVRGSRLRHLLLSRHGNRPRERAAGPEAVGPAYRMGELYPQQGRRIVSVNSWGAR